MTRMLQYKDEEYQKEESSRWNRWQVDVLVKILQKKKKNKFIEAGILSKTMQYSVVSKCDLTVYQVYIPFPPTNGYVH